MTSRPIVSQTPDSATTESQQSAVRLGLIGRGIDQSLAPAFHTLAGRMLGTRRQYELLPREAALSTELDGLLEELGRCRLPRCQHHGAVQGVGLAGLVRCGRRGGEHRRREHAAARTGRSDERVQHRLLGIQVGLPPTLRERAPRDRRTARRRRRRNRHRRGARRPRRDGHPRSTTSSPTDRTHLPTCCDAATRSLRVDVAASAEDAVDGVDGVVNGTPVGMYFQPGAPVELAAIGEQRWVFDAIYSPIETELMARAADDEVARISGFDLFMGQGIDAFEIFTGHRPRARRPRRPGGPDAGARTRSARSDEAVVIRGTAATSPHGLASVGDKRRSGSSTRRSASALKARWACPRRRRGGRVH